MDYSYAITEPVHAGAATIYANSVFAGSHYVTATVLGHGIAITEEVTVGFNLIPSFLLAERPDPEALMPPPPVPTCGTAAPSGNLTYITYLDQHPTTSLSGQHIIWLHQIEYLVTVGGYRVLVVLLGEWERKGGYVGRLMELNESDSITLLFLHGFQTDRATASYLSATFKNTSTFAHLPASLQDLFLPLKTALTTPLTTIQVTMYPRSHSTLHTSYLNPFATLLQIPHTVLEVPLLPTLDNPIADYSGDVFVTPSSATLALVTSSRDAATTGVTMTPKVAIPARYTPTGDGDFSVCYVGRLDPDKTVFSLAEVVRDTHEWIKWRIVGTGMFKGVLETMVDGLGVEFVGDVDNADVFRVLRGCHVYYNPSVYPQSFGISIVEAMGAGVPVVAYDVGGVDYLGNNSNCIVPAVATKEAVVRVLVALKGDEGLRERIGRGGKAFVEEHFSGDIGRDYEALYRGLLGGDNSNGTCTS